jgi:hypothetical protein
MELKEIGRGAGKRGSGYGPGSFKRMNSKDRGNKFEENAGNTHMAS